MSYHRLGETPGFPPGFTPTTAFVSAIDPGAFKQFGPGTIFSPYGWGPEMMYGMPASYTHHVGYERVPVGATTVEMHYKPRIIGTRRPLGPMYDELSPPRWGFRLGNYEHDYAGIFDAGAFGPDTADYRHLGDAGDGLGGILAVL